jgi:hypothetical protein
VFGDFFCTRMDCIINVEKRRHAQGSAVSGKRRRDTKSLGHDEAGGGIMSGNKRAGKYGRYPTSPSAMEILMSALESQGLWKEREVGETSASATTVFDICGTPLDSICGYFECVEGVTLYANDLHPPLTISRVAATKAPGVLFTHFDACLESFPSTMMETISTSRNASSRRQIGRRSFQSSSSRTTDNDHCCE